MTCGISDDPTWVAARSVAPMQNAGPPRCYALPITMPGNAPGRFLRLLSVGVLSCVWMHCGGDDTQEEEPSCGDIARQSLSGIESAEEAANRSCAQDSDCSLFNFALPCIPACTGDILSVATSSLSELETEKRSRVEKYCEQVERSHCEWVAPSCGAGGVELGAICVDGTCDLCADEECASGDAD